MKNSIQLFVIFLISAHIGITLSFNLDYNRLSAKVRKWEDELVRIKDCGQIEEIPGEPRTKAPWTAAIFLKRKESYEFLLGATIISPTIVLSIFGGPYGALPRGARGTYGLFKPEQLLVGAGLLSGNISHTDQYSQRAEVKYIIPYNRHSARNTHYHLFLLHLKTPLNITTPYVRAVCIHLDPRSYYTFAPKEVLEFIDKWPFNWEGPASGFLSSPGREFVVTQGKSGSKELCDSVFKYYYRNVTETAHVFCTKYKFPKQEEAGCWSYGSVQVLWLEVLKRWMVSGITALIPSKKKGGKCKTSSWYFNANFVYGPETEWMIEHIECGSNSFACPLGECIPLSSVCDGIRDCPTGDDEEPIYCGATNECKGHPKGWTHQCGFGGKCINPALLCNGEFDCDDGSDERLSKCVPTIVDTENSTAVATPVTCPTISISEGVVLRCSDQSGVSADCASAKVGTQARLSCEPFYISRLRFARIRMTCAENGQWEPFRAFSCEPECGIINSPDIEPYIYDGIAVTSSDLFFPWYAAVFRTAPGSDGGGKMEFICGGSLIESQAIVSAAHCFVGVGENSDSDLDNLRIVLGANSSDFNLILESGISQIFQVSRFWKPPSFDLANLRSDIALVRLNGSVTYGSDIRPVCYLSSYDQSKAAPNPGNVGKIAGFGIDETGSVSKVLKYTELPVVPEDQCERPGTAQTHGSFCAGALNKTTVCPGDSGGGLVFPFPKSTAKYILKGVASHGKRKGTTSSCNLEDYAVFTHLDTFDDWMNLILEKMEVENPDENELFDE